MRTLTARRTNVRRSVVRRPADSRGSHEQRCSYRRRAAVRDVRWSSAEAPCSPWTTATGFSTDADVVVVDGRIAAIGVAAEAPPDAYEIDARGGIVMPGMIDSHRHMWQTAMRAYGADWTLTQYFVWYYLEHGRRFRPVDVRVGNAISAWEAHRGRGDHDRRLVPRPADRRACRGGGRRTAVESPAGSCWPTATSRPAPWEWTALPEVRRFLTDLRDAGDDRLGVQLAFDVTGDPTFPEQPAFEVARELGLPVTTHAGVWGATNDTGIQQMHDHGFATQDTVYVHAASSEHGLLPTDRRHRRLDLGVDGVRAERRSGLPAHLAGASARHRRRRCPTTPASGGAAICSRRCAPPWERIGPASTWRPMPRATR